MTEPIDWKKLLDMGELKDATEEIDKTLATAASYPCSNHPDRTIVAIATFAPHRMCRECYEKEINNDQRIERLGHRVIYLGGYTAAAGGGPSA